MGNYDAGRSLVEAINAQVLAEISAKRTNVKAIAAEMGANYYTIRRYLNGEREMPVSVLVQICMALGMDAQEVVKRAEQRME